MLRLLFHKKAHAETAVYFGVSVFFGMLPLLFGIMLAQGVAGWNGWEPFWHDGEFYLYSVSFFSSAMYIFFTKKRTNTDFAALSLLICVAALIVSAFLYAAVATSLIDTVQGINFDKQFLYKTSLALLIFSLLACYVSGYLEQLYKDIDPVNENRFAIKGLLNDI